MFESRKNYYSTRRNYYSKKKSAPYYLKHSNSKYKSKRPKGALIEIEDNFTYQNTEPTTSKTSNEIDSQKQLTEQQQPQDESNVNVPCKEVSEFTLSFEQEKETSYDKDTEDDKENNLELANLQNNKLNIKDDNNNNNNNTEPHIKNTKSSSSLSSSELSIETLPQNNQLHNNVTSTNSSTPQINLSNETLKEAYFFPKKLTNIYNYIYNQFQYQCHLYNNVNNTQFYQGHHQPQFRTTSNNNITSSFNLNPPSFTNTISSNNPNQNPSYLRHNSSSNTSSTLLVRSNSSVTSSSNSSCSIAPFSYYDTSTPPFSVCNTSQTNNIPPKLNANSFGLNKINIPNINGNNNIALSNGNTLTDKEKENTDVLSINLKISDKEILMFKIRRYDDMFQTVKIFCEINHLEQKFIRPLILHVIKAMNIIYGIVNMTLNEDEIKELQRIKGEIV